MAFNAHKPASLDLPQTKLDLDEEQALQNYRLGNQNGLSRSSSLAILINAVDSDLTPISPLSISPSPSRIDDAMSDVSTLSPCTPFMGMSPTSLSPCTSTLALDPFVQSPSPRSLPAPRGDASAPSKVSLRAKAKGFVFKLPGLPSSQSGHGLGLRSPVDLVHQQGVSPLPSPVARDLRRRAEAGSEDLEMDIAASCEQANYGFDLGAVADPTPDELESSCLGLDLGLPVIYTDEDISDLGPYATLGPSSREVDEAIGVNREPGVNQFRAKIMQASVARSASAELVSSPEKSQVRHSSPVSSASVSMAKSPNKSYPRKNIPLPEPHLKSPLALVPAGEQDRAAYTPGPLPMSTSVSAPERIVFKRGTCKQNSRANGSFGQFLDARPLSPSPKRGPIHRDTSATELMQLRMHGAAAFPKHFPEGYLLESNFVQHHYLETELGAGGYGFVLIARNRITDAEVAVKFIRRSQVPNRGLVRDYKNDVVPLEAVVLQLAEHPGVVKFYGLYQDELYFYLVQELHGSPWSKNVKNKHKSDLDSGTPQGNPTGPQANTARSKPSSPLSPYAPIQSSPLRPLAPSISMSAIPTPGRMPLRREGEMLAPRGSLPLLVRPQMPRRASYDLFECIEQHERLSEGQAKYIFAQVVDTVWYLDSIGITHRDIKDENLVIDKDFKVKFIDFGSAVIRDVRRPPPTYTSFFGTLTFASPEILKNLPYTAPPAEVWTLGILLSFLVTGQSPFPTEEYAKNAVMCDPHESVIVSSACGDLMRRCLHPDPASRLTVQQVRVHPWLRGALGRA